VAVGLTVEEVLWLIRERQAEVHIEMVSAIWAVDLTLPETFLPIVVIPSPLKAALLAGVPQLETVPIVHDNLQMAEEELFLDSLALAAEEE